MVEQPVSRRTLTGVPSTDPSATGILLDLSGDWHASATTGKRIPVLAEGNHGRCLTMMARITQDKTFWAEVPTMGLADYAVPAIIVGCGTSRLACSDLFLGLPKLFFL